MLELESPRTQFDETVVPFRDDDGQPLELVTATTDVEPWAAGPVPAENAIRGFHSVTLEPINPEQTGGVLETLGYEPNEQDDDRTRYRATGDRSAIVNLRHHADAHQGRQGVGTVHHGAFRTPDDETQLEWREQLNDSGLRVTAQKDRQYFKSIYFREPGGVLFEIATDGPGIARDESEAELRMELKQPRWLEDERERLEERLPEIRASGLVIVPVEDTTTLTGAPTDGCWQYDQLPIAIKDIATRGTLPPGDSETAMFTIYDDPETDGCFPDGGYLERDGIDLLNSQESADDVFGAIPLEVTITFTLDQHVSVAGRIPA